MNLIDILEEEERQAGELATFRGGEEESKTIELIKQFQELAKVTHVSEKSIGIRISRFILIYCGSFLHLNYYDNQLGAGDDQSEQQQQEKGKPHKIKMRFLREICRPQFVVYLLAVAWVWLATIFQYRYDTQTFRLETLKSRLEETTTTSADYIEHNTSLVRQITEQLVKANEAEADLRWVGAPFISMRLSIEVIYVYILIVSMATYLHACIRFNSTLVFDFPLARLILDPRRESGQYSQLITEQLAKLVASSSAYSRAWRSFCLASTGSISETLKISNHQLMQHQNMINELVNMASSGRLRPLNWSHSFRFKLPQNFGIFVVLLSIYVVILLEFVRQMFFKSSGEIQTGMVDITVFVLTIILLFYATFACIYFISYVFFYSLDQIYYVNSLIELMSKIIESNRRNLMKLIKTINSWKRIMKKLTTPKSPIDIEGKPMNSNLLFGLIHFKLFVAQFDRATQSSSLVILTTTILFFCMPIVSRLHLPYLDSEYFKWLAIGVSLATIVLFNFTILPVCYLHSRSLRLYRTLNSLMAHLVETTTVAGSKQEHSSDTNNLARIYDNHLVWLLRRELDHPERLTKRFAFRAGGLEFTYQTLVRAHFWFGIIILSVVSGISSANSSSGFFGYFLSDPFKLYSF